MPLGIDTFGHRRRMPHLARSKARYTVAFSTRNREKLPPGARTLVLASCTHDHGRLCWIDCVVVMPDHVHLIVVPYEDSSLTAVLARLKGASAWFINRHLRRRGNLWQEESFDRIVRSTEQLHVKRDYLVNNAVRAGLVSRWEEYPWLWLPARELLPIYTASRSGATGS